MKNNMYILIKEGVITDSNYSLTKLKTDNVNVSFPAVVSQDLLAEYGVFFVVQDLPQDIGPLDVAKKSEIVFENGVWVQKYIVEKASDEEIAQKETVAASDARLIRDKLLTKSDWVVIKSLENNQPLSFEWATYRQQLRDLTNQVGFPFSITWPSAPV